MLKFRFCRTSRLHKIDLVSAANHKAAGRPKDSDTVEGTYTPLVSPDMVPENGETGVMTPLLTPDPAMVTTETVESGIGAEAHGNIPDSCRCTGYIDLRSTSVKLKMGHMVP